MQFIGIGDLHLTDERGKGGLANYIELPAQYVTSEVQRVLDWAARKGVTNIFLYGDVCENPRMSYEGQLALITLFRKNPEFQFWVILGNHDKETHDFNSKHSLEVLEKIRFKNCRIITEPTTEIIDKAKVRFLPWPSTDFDPEALNIAHIEVRGSKTDSGRTMDDEKLSKSKAVTCMGHLHTAHKVRNTYYSGTLYQTNFGESLPKYFHYGQFKSPKDYEIDLVPFDPLYKLHQRVIETQADVEALTTDAHDLYKLVVADGADVVIPDRPNIVMVKAFKTKQELKAILTEDLVTGQELVLKSDEFFNTWLDAQDVDPKLKNKTRKLRLERLAT